MRKAIFIDKDGTLISNVPYNTDPGKIVLEYGAIEGLRLLQQRGYALIVVSNQSGIAHGYFKEEDMQPVITKVRIKKYFYALRPALAALWIIEKKTVPPITFHELRVLVEDEEWNVAANDLLERKKLADEKSTITPVPVLHEWIEKTISYCKEQSSLIPAIQRDTIALNHLFRKHIKTQ